MQETDGTAWKLLREAFRYGPAGEHPADWVGAHGWTSGEVTTLARFREQDNQAVPPNSADRARSRSGCSAPRS